MLLLLLVVVVVVVVDEVTTDESNNVAVLFRRISCYCSDTETGRRVLLIKRGEGGGLVENLSLI